LPSKQIEPWNRIKVCPNCGQPFTNEDWEDQEFYWDDLTNIRVLYYRTCPACNKTWCCIDVYGVIQEGTPFEQKAIFD